MAKCGLCLTKKGKRYCSPLDKVICPICCAESRVVKIDCNEDCRHLEGTSFQKKRSEDREFSELMGRVGHGQFDDIFQRVDVAGMAFKIESLVRAFYVRGDMPMTDTSVYEAYKAVYMVMRQGKSGKHTQMDELVEALLTQYEASHRAWREKLDKETIGQVYLRLMISVKAMSGGQFGEYGYLNYLKNNLGQNFPAGEVLTEDKFGNIIREKLR